MNENNNTSYHIVVRGKMMAYWHVFGGLFMLGSATSSSQKVKKN